MKIFFNCKSARHCKWNSSYIPLWSMSWTHTHSVFHLISFDRLIQKKEGGTCLFQSVLDVFRKLWIDVLPSSRLTGQSSHWCGVYSLRLERKLIFFSHHHPASIHWFHFGRPVKPSGTHSLHWCEDIISFSQASLGWRNRLVCSSWMCLQLSWTDPSSTKELHGARFTLECARPLLLWILTGVKKNRPSFKSTDMTKFSLSFVTYSWAPMPCGCRCQSIRSQLSRSFDFAHLRLRSSSVGILLFDGPRILFLVSYWTPC